MSSSPKENQDVVPQGDGAQSPADENMDIPGGYEFEASTSQIIAGQRAGPMASNCEWLKVAVSGIASTFVPIASACSTASR
ncbi:hypothetical protein LHYA1_G003033 [Lachnellula hyalina]|uniref:Uncharacterized protein n=1 Tax=Lachnellula hyalina TaxID=1316788 RepID=A0A8H8R3P0_9HELO|nr:uncharacterized protein LHYA1_G003033 [Lachnellula hyalina]TVY27928.1 hypothetical protein LHYA1_G003033 [Lachnellula hyalina]